MNRWREMAIVTALAIQPAQSAHARASHAVDITGGTLKSGIDKLAAQTGSSIALADATLGRLRIPPIAGRMSAEKALRRMVRELPVAVIVIDATSFRVVRDARGRPPRSERSRRPVGPAMPMVPTPVEEILVTASKRYTAASRYPGTIVLIGADEFALAASTGTAAIEQAGTSISSTHLGTGRDKLFIRGVADSSFSGHTQATVGQYFGEARINYTGPDPSLRLYDVVRAEVLLGPQGTLYGAGSLGGTLRIEPHAPDPATLATKAVLSTSLTQHGAPGAEAAAILNLPLGWRDGAIRIVAYRVHEGGYVDDLARGVRNSNGLDVLGGRASISVIPAAGWRAEITGIGQNIDSRDASYADRRLARLSRTAALAQPYASRFRLASSTLRRESGDLDAVANISYAHIFLHDRFDATPLPDVYFLSRRDGSSIVAAEIRASRATPSGGWLAGASFVRSRARLASYLEYLDGSRLEALAATTAHEAALFGEATQMVGPLAFTVGARAVHWRGRTQNAGRTGLPETLSVKDQGRKLLPAASALINITDDLQLLVRYASSYRPPTAASSPGGISTLSGDRYAAWEFGARLPGRQGRPISGSLALTIGRWRNVQADLFDNRGYLIAANVGNARTISLEAMTQIRLSGGVSLNASATINGTSLVPVEPGVINITEGRLPNVPDINGRLAISYTSPQGERLPVRLSAKLRYVGRSKLGVGADLDRWQGGFTQIDADASVRVAGAEWFISATNLLGNAGNRFALGSIAQAGSAHLFIPQGPRTVMMGVRLGGA